MLHLFPNYRGVIALISTTKNGNIDGRFSPAGKTNLNRWLKQIHLSPQKIVQAEQIHQARIAVIESKTEASELAGTIVPGVDGFLSNQSNIYLMIRTADCFPVFLYDPKHQVVGLIHVGWRGALANIHLAALDRLQHFFHSSIKDILIAVGPGICPKCYQFTIKPIQADMPQWTQFVHAQHDSWSIDLLGFLKQSLLQAGIAPKNLETVDDCTAENPHWFSHVRSLKTGEKEGRFASIIGIKNDK